ncbi:hypothetical protein CDD83_94 [Cordyceps sp. RAO-2017]|nr:hypothetical protein CDD83_94 [Cordyceps sp. RAO-2017]
MPRQSPRLGWAAAWPQPGRSLAAAWPVATASSSFTTTLWTRLQPAAAAVVQEACRRGHGTDGAGPWRGRMPSAPYASMACVWALPPPSPSPPPPPPPSVSLLCLPPPPRLSRRWTGLTTKLTDHHFTSLSNPVAKDDCAPSPSLSPRASGLEPGWRRRIAPAADLSEKLDCHG